MDDLKSKHVVSNFKITQSVKDLKMREKWKFNINTK